MSNFKEELISGIINNPILYISHYHQYFIEKEICGIAKELVHFDSHEPEYIVRTISCRRDNTCYNKEHGIGYINGIQDNPYKKEDVNKYNSRDYIYTFIMALQDAIKNKNNNNLPCIYIFENVDKSLLTNPEFVSLLHTFAAFHEMEQDRRYYTIVLIVPSLIPPPIEIEGIVRVLSLTPPTEFEIDSIVKDYFGEQQDNQIRADFQKTLQGLQRYDIQQIIQSTKAVIGDKLSYRSVQWARNEKQQIIKKTGILNVETPDVSFSDIGGLENLVADLKKKAALYKHINEIQSSVNNQIKCPIPKGVLIIGMPGCGKTMIAKAVASEFELPLLRLDINRLLGQYVGQSETNLRKALEVVESAHPCVLWIDEIEKAFAGTNNRSGENNDLMVRLMGSFLTWMQERKTPVFIVATANDVMKPEFMRKGRFDEVYFVDFPNIEERTAILTKIIDDYKNTIFQFTGDDKVIEDIARKLQPKYEDGKKINNPYKEVGLSGAEIKALINSIIEQKIAKAIEKCDIQNKNINENRQDLTSFLQKDDKNGNGHYHLSIKDFFEDGEQFCSIVKDAIDCAMCHQSSRVSEWIKSGQNDNSNKQEGFIDRIYDFKTMYHFKDATKTGSSPLFSRLKIREKL